MQTPGRQVEPQTPMIAISRRVDMTMERLTQVEEDVVNIERPQKRILGSVISQFQTINNNMQEMRDLINQDIKDKKKYYREETKILRKDSRNLQSLNMGFGRKLAAGALGLYGLSQLSQGNFGEGAAGIGGAATLLTPEILSVISTIVTTKLVKSGLLGRGAGAGTIGTRVAGASRLKNPLLITAALAASFILPGLINSNQNADRRRQLDATRVIRGREIINKPDVDRFRGILARFDSILSNISLERRRKGKDTIDEEIILDPSDKKDDQDNVQNNNQEGDNDVEFEPGSETSNNNDIEGIDLSNVKSANDLRELGLDPKEYFINMRTGEVGRIDELGPMGKVGLFLNTSIRKMLGQKGDVDLSMNPGNTEFNSNIAVNLENKDESSSSLLANLSVDMLEGRTQDNIIRGEGGNKIINVSSDNNQTTPVLGGRTPNPVFVSVGTKFASIPKFESASALRTWGAFV